MKLSSSGLRPKVAVLFLVLIQLRTEAMQITSSGPQTIQKPVGDTVQLGCTFTPGSQDTGELDIEWSNVSPDMTQKDNLILSYSAGQTHYYDINANRIKFSENPVQGDASLSIFSVTLSDTGTYQCKVKKSPGVDMRKVTLVVMVPPSVPKCWVEGSEEKGGTVSMRCNSLKGSSPLMYTWKRETGGAMPTTATQDPQTGEILFKNHTDSNAGKYVCEVKNAVGQQQCAYFLKAYNPTDKVGVIVGAVFGALLLLLLLLFLIWLLICCCQKKRYQKEAANEIREDVPAPESRPTSRQSSRRSTYQPVVGYRTHHGLQYNSLVTPQPNGSELGITSTGSINGRAQMSDTAPRLHYDPQYGYAV
ncbi:V-set and immunoglobulin domain-containing protein 8b [Oryzias melastigma]|uniref:V-set and immunoglobulin domain containing 8b n=1 Tax=Oryzias melastigma TaxID=30732 RepID=A0A3B3CBJ6_ORYME|nr:V-set and immunoglobulin domain-containing protein 8b [Oryzias melastigma]